jgi:carbon-monoxide dehydrogenase large subunit
LSLQYIGQPIKERESLRFITGSSIFVDDTKFSDCTFMAVLRSQYAHALLKRVDVSQALKLNGVISVLTGKDAVRLSRPLRTRLAVEGIKVAEHYCLASERVRYVGEPIAAVVAENRYVAADALDQIDIEYKLLEPTVTAQDSLNSKTLIYPEWKNNVAFFRKFSSGEDIDGIFAKAAVTLEEDINSHRYTGTPIETRNYAAKYENRDRTLTLYTSTQNPHVTRTLLADALGLPENRVRVIMPDVGGAFGLKHPLYPEEILVSLFAMKTGRPVKWSELRTENLQSMHHAREQSHHIKVAADVDGKILAIDDQIVVDLGAYYPTAGPFSALVTAHYLTGPYAIKNYRYELICVVTNKTPYGAYRGFGKSDSNFVMERIIDHLAVKLGLDPSDVRFKNLIESSAFPYTSVTGAVYDSGSYHIMLRKLLDVVDYDQIRKEQRIATSAQKKDSNIRRGIGLAFVLEPSGVSYPGSFISSYDSVLIRMDPSGKVTVLSGGAPQGQSYETATAQLVADSLGINVEDISAIHGDTQTCPYGLGSYSSRFAVVLAPTIIEASRKLKEKLLKVGAHLLSEDICDLEIRNGVLSSRTTGKKMTVHDLARIFYTSPDRLPPGTELGLEVTVYRDSSPVKSAGNLYLTSPYAAAAIIVDVDIETGVIRPIRYVIVHDCGNVINEAIVEGQIIGGAVQGMGGAILEELIYDNEGNLITSTFMDYLIPTASDFSLPKIELYRMTTPSPFVLGGFKGAGEAGILCSPPALANAVEDSLREFGFRVSEMPMKPNIVWSGIVQSIISRRLDSAFLENKEATSNSKEYSSCKYSF